MARIYQTRQLLDPSMFGQMNQSLAQQYQAGHNYNQGMANAISQGLQGVGTAAQGAYDRYKQNQAIDERKQTIAELLNSKDPTVRAAAEQYAREGNASGLLQLRMYEQTQAARNAELLQRRAELQAKEKRESELQLADARPKATALVAKLQDPNISEIERDMVNKELNALIEKHGDALMPKDELNRIQETVAQDIENKRTLELANKAKDDYSFDNRMRIESKVLPNAKNITDKANYKSMIKQLHDNGKLNDEDYKALYNKIEGTKTLGEKKKEGTEGAVAGHVAKQTTDKLEKNAAQKKLADAGREALSKGRRPTRAQQKAIDEGY